MTLRNAEKITGCEIRNISIDTWAAFENDVEVARVEAKPKHAPRLIVSAVYKLRRRQVFLEQGFRCAECGDLMPLDGSTGLDCHHVVHRSKGRSDARSNLKGLCNACHDRAHGVRRK